MPRRFQLERLSFCSIRNLYPAHLELPRPFARPLDRRVFDLIERDADENLPLPIALAELKALLREGARNDCHLVYAVRELDQSGGAEESEYWDAEFDSFTPLEMAALLNLVKWIDVFIEAGLSVNERGAARTAAYQGHVEFLRALHRAGAVDSAGCGELLHSSCDKPEIVKDLLAWGADPNCISDGRSALHVASFKKMETIRMLLAAGANPNQPDREGRTPFANFMWCAELIPHDHDEGVALFLTHGANSETPIPDYDAGGFKAKRGEELTSRECIERGLFPRAQEVLREIDMHRAGVSRTAAK